MQARAESDELSLLDYGSILRRHWIVSLTTAGLVIGLSVAYLVAASPSYESTASVLLRTQSNQQIFPSVGNSQSAAFVLSPVAELEFANSGTFSATANAASPPGATVTPRYQDGDSSSFERSSELEFVARSNDPVASRGAADAWAATYVDVRQQLALDEVNATIATTEARVDELEVLKAEILEPLEPINEALATETDSDTIGRLTTQRLALQQSLDDELLPVRSELATITSDLSSLRIRATFLEREGMSARISTPASVGTKVSPLIGRTIALSMVVAAILAAAAALLRDNLRTAIDTRADVARAVGDIPVLAEIPPLDRVRSEIGDDGIDPSLAIGTTYVEAFETLVTSLGLLHLGSGSARLLVTSPQASEGKTTVSGHLAVRLKASGVDTAVIDADLRRPNLHNVLGLTNDDGGLSSVLAGEAELFGAIRNNGFVSALLAGPPVESPAAIIRSPELGLVVDKLAARHDFVVIDSPPVLVVSDAQALAAIAVDDVLLVVRAGQTTRTDLSEAVARLDAAGKRPVGIVLTDARRTAAGAYGSNYAAR